MKPLAFELVPVAALLVLLLYSPAVWAWNGTIWPYTTQAFVTVDVLQRVVQLDRQISRAWAPNNRILGEFYFSKARAAQRLIERLDNCQPVSSLAVERVLDNRDAQRLGGEPWNVPDGPTHF